MVFTLQAVWRKFTTFSDLICPGPRWCRITCAILHNPLVTGGLVERVYSSLSEVQEDTPSYNGLYCMVLWKQRNIAEFEGPTQSTEEILRLVSRQVAESLVVVGC